MFKPNSNPFSLISGCLLAGCLAFGQNSASPLHKNQQQGNAAKREKVAQNPPTPPTVTCVCAPPQESPQPQAPAANRETKNWREWFWPPEWASWALVIVAIWTAFIAIGTLRQIEQETKHSGELAKAAKDIAQTAVENATAASATARAAERSAESVKNIYRAWVLTGWTMGNIADKFELWIHNYGQTPAQVISKHSKTEIVDNEAALANLPIPPDYGKNQLLAPQMIAPNSKDSIVSFDIKTWANVLGEWASLYQGEKITVIYGLIKYRDVLDPKVEHETRFCNWHSYKRNGLNVGGPPEYNKAS